MKNTDSTQLCTVKIKARLTQPNGLSKGIVFLLVPVRVESNENIDSVDDSRDIAKDCEQQADAELHLVRNKKAYRQYVTGLVNINIGILLPQ